MTLNAKLPKQPLWAFASSNSGRLRLEFEMKRLIYTLNRKRRDKLMSQLEKYNGEIQSLLGNSERLEPMRRKRRSPVMRYFQLIRIQAQSLHTALTYAWYCGESSAHSAKLLLEKRVRSDDAGRGKIEDLSTIKFKILFSHEKSEQGSTSISFPPSSSLDWYAAEIESIDSNQAFDTEQSTSSSTRQKLALSDTSSQRSTGVASLGTNVSHKESRRVSFLESSTQPKTQSAAD